MGSKLSAASEITKDWSVGTTLTADRVYQCRVGEVALSTEAAPGDHDGIILQKGDALLISSGKTVKDRKVNSGNAILTWEDI